MQLQELRVSFLDMPFGEQEVLLSKISEAMRLNLSAKPVKTRRTKSSTEPKEARAKKPSKRVINALRNIALDELVKMLSGKGEIKNGETV